MAKYLATVDAKLLFEFLATFFYAGSAGMVLGSWRCPYLGRIFTSGKHVAAATGGSVWVSKSKFLHVYIWGFIANMIMYMSVDHRGGIPFIRIMIAAHTLRRALEVLVASKRPFSKMNLMAYMYGIVFYTILPLVTFGETSQHRSIVNIIFPIASLIQCLVHLVLGRKKAYDKNVGFVFRYFNHLAELAIFACVYLMSPSRPALWMLVYVTLCMFKLIHLNYTWYSKKK